MNRPTSSLDAITHLFKLEHDTILGQLAAMKFALSPGDALDVRLCVDLDGASWFLETGAATYVGRETEYCGISVIRENSVLEDLLADLLHQVLEECLAAEAAERDDF